MRFQLPNMRLSMPRFQMSNNQRQSHKGVKIVLAVALSFFAMQALFLGVMSLLFGAEFKNENRVWNLDVLAVDYDGELIGESLNKGYAQLQNNTFPTVHFESNKTYPTVQSIQDAVRSGHYWGAVYTWPNASYKLSEALLGGQAAEAYNPKEVMTFIWSGSRYPAVSEGYIQPNLNHLIEKSTDLLKQYNGTHGMQVVMQSDFWAVQAYLNPIVASSVDLNPMTQGARFLYNTASVTMSVVMMLFFVLAINGISERLSLFIRFGILANFVVRQALAAGFTLIAALLQVAYIWGFKETWDLKGGVFALLWMLSWLHMWVNFLIIDVAVCFVPMQYMLCVVVLWVLLNVTSSIVAIPIAAHFYRFAYAMPSHNWYEAFITITTNGASNTIYRTLPILFGWFVLGLLLGGLAAYWRCQKARKVAQTIPATEKPMDLRNSSTLPYAGTGHNNASEETMWQQPAQPASGCPNTTWPDYAQGVPPAPTGTGAQQTQRLGNAYYPNIPVAY